MPGSNSASRTASTTPTSGSSAAATPAKAEHIHVLLDAVSVSARFQVLAQAVADAGPGISTVTIAVHRAMSRAAETRLLEAIGHNHAKAVRCTDAADAAAALMVACVNKAAAHCAGESSDSEDADSKAKPDTARLVILSPSNAGAWGRRVRAAITALPPTACTVREISSVIIELRALPIVAPAPAGTAVAAATPAAVAAAAVPVGGDLSAERRAAVRGLIAKGTTNKSDVLSQCRTNHGALFPDTQLARDTLADCIANGEVEEDKTQRLPTVRLTGVVRKTAPAHGPAAAAPAAVGTTSPAAVNALLSVVRELQEKSDGAAPLKSLVGLRTRQRAKYLIADKEALKATFDEAIAKGLLVESGDSGAKKISIPATAVAAPAPAPAAAAAAGAAGSTTDLVVTVVRELQANAGGTAPLKSLVGLRVRERAGTAIQDKEDLRAAVEDAVKKGLLVESGEFSAKRLAVGPNAPVVAAAAVAAAPKPVARTPPAAAAAAPAPAAQAVTPAAINLIADVVRDLTEASGELPRKSLVGARCRQRGRHLVPDKETLQAAFEAAIASGRVVESGVGAFKTLAVAARPVQPNTAAAAAAPAKAKPSSTAAFSVTSQAAIDKPHPAAAPAPAPRSYAAAAAGATRGADAHDGKVTALQWDALVTTVRKLSPSGAQGVLKSRVVAECLKQASLFPTAQSVHDTLASAGSQGLVQETGYGALRRVHANPKTTIVRHHDSSEDDSDDEEPVYTNRQQRPAPAAAPAAAAHHHDGPVGDIDDVSDEDLEAVAASVARIMKGLDADCIRQIPAGTLQRVASAFGPCNTAALRRGVHLRDRLHWRAVLRAAVDAELLVQSDDGYRVGLPRNAPTVNEPQRLVRAGHAVLEEARKFIVRMLKSGTPEPRAKVAKMLMDYNVVRRGPGAPGVCDAAISMLAAEGTIEQRVTRTAVCVIVAARAPRSADVVSYAFGPHAMRMIFGWTQTDASPGAAAAPRPAHHDAEEDEEEDETTSSGDEPVTRSQFQQRQQPNRPAPRAAAGPTNGAGAAAAKPAPSPANRLTEEDFQALADFIVGKLEGLEPHGIVMLLWFVITTRLSSAILRDLANGALPAGHSHAWERRAQALKAPGPGIALRAWLARNESRLTVVSFNQNVCSVGLARHAEAVKGAKPRCLKLGEEFDDDRVYNAIIGAIKAEGQLSKEGKPQAPRAVAVDALVDAGLVDEDDLERANAALFKLQEAKRIDCHLEQLDSAVLRLRE